MSELTTIPTAELAALKERLGRLAREKAQLQLIALLMNRLSELPGLDNAVDGMLRFVMDILGGQNVTLFYPLEGAIHSVDVHGRREVMAEADDDLVRQVFATHEFVSKQRVLEQAGGPTAERPMATTWVMPLTVGTELVGVLRMDDLLVAGRELQDEVQTFLRYASLVLKNELSGETRLRQAFDEVSRANRAEAALAERHSTLRGIIEGTPSPIFALDRQYRYVAFNRSHAAVMKALYGAEIEIGRSILDSMTVAEDRETARGNLDRALAGEHLVESSQSGEEQRTRRYFEVAHHPVRADDGQVVGVAVFANDITDRRRAEEERRTNLRIAESLDQVNRAIQATQDLEQMMSEVLGVSLAIFGCDRAFLLYPCDPETPSYRVPMERTRPEYPGALARGLEVPVDAASAPVLRVTRESAGPVTFGFDSEPPLPRILTEGFGVQSQIAMAVHPKGHQPYMFGLHQCSHPRVWTPEEKRLFQDIGRRLSDALSSLLAHRELQDGEARYRRITEGLTDYLYSVRVEDGRPVETKQSPACAIVTGYTAEEFAADPHLWLRMVRPEDRDLVRERVGQILSGQDTPPIEHRILRKDGAVRWVCDTTILLRDASGRLLSYDGVIKDITDRKQAEEALRESEHRYRGIFDNVLDGLYLLEATQDGRFRTLDVNPALERATGIPRGGVIGKTQEEAVPEETARIVNAKYRRCVEAGRPIDEEVLLDLPSGRRWFHSTLIPTRDDSGRISRIIGISRDITERKQAAIDLARANRALRMLSDSNQALVRITDETTLLNEVCRIAVEVGGYRMAWVGMAEQDEARTVRAVAHAGLESGYLASANITWGDGERGRGPSGTAIRTGQPCIARNIPTDPAFAPWREAAIQRGYNSIIALPLMSGGHALGVLGIYSAEADAFDANEVTILEELASDLAFGVSAQRTLAERDRAEQALQRSEERYRTLIQRIRAGVVVHAPDTQVLASNALAQELLGLTEAQMLGKMTVDPDWHFFREDGTVMPPDEYPVSQVLATRRPLRDFVVGVHRPHGAPDVWVLVNADPVTGGGGDVAQVIVTFVEITERKRAEAALRERDAELNESQRLAHIGSWDWDAVGDTIWWSAEYYHIYGLDPSEPTPKYLDHLRAYTPESAERLSALVERAMETGEAYEVDLELAQPTASTRWVVARGEAKRDATGRIVGLRGTAQNITERKRAEQKLQEQLNELQRWHEVTLGREERIQELKREVNRLLAQMDQPPRYPSQA